MPAEGMLIAALISRSHETFGLPAQVRVCRLGTVRQWKLPDSMHLKAGKLNAVETSTFLRELGAPGGRGALMATDDS